MLFVDFVLHRLPALPFAYGRPSRRLPHFNITYLYQRMVVEQSSISPHVH